MEIQSTYQVKSKDNGNLVALFKVKNLYGTKVFILKDNFNREFTKGNILMLSGFDRELNGYEFFNMTTEMKYNEPISDIIPLELIEPATQKETDQVIAFNKRGFENFMSKIYK